MLRLPRTRRAYLQTAVSGLAAFAALYVIAHQVLSRFGIRAENTYLDDVLLGLMVGVLVVALEAQHELEVRTEKRRAQLLLHANRHIDDVLRTITYVNSSSIQADESERVAQATRRIDLALRELRRAGKHTHGRGG